MQLTLPGLEILTELQSGPVRAVLLARQTDLGRQVRVICLAPGVSPSSRLADALSREARAYARLDHPNIPRLFDFRKDEAQSWLVLEDSGGEGLSRALPAPVSFQVATALVISIARALGHAHERGVAHGRVSAAHIELTTSGQVKLGGFGLSPRGEEGEVEPLELATSSGVSPEATLGQPPSPAGDMFGCGCLLFELLTARAPFGPPESVGFEARVRTDKVPSLLTEVSHVPSALDLLTRRCLEKLPSRRPESMAELEQELTVLLEEPPEAVLRRALEVGAPSDSPTRDKPPRRERPLGMPDWLRRPRQQGLVAGLALGTSLCAAAFWLSQRKPTAPPPVLTREQPTPSANSVSLRAVASPWAHVVVDGKHLQTTPFAVPLALSPGKHEVRFEHPNAAPEIRNIEGAPGESIFLDVVLRVERPPLPVQPLGDPIDDSP